VFCIEYMTPGGDGGGICPPGSVPSGGAWRCSNIQGPCAIPCTPDPEFCVDAPMGCGALDQYMYCHDKGQEGGYCSDSQNLGCIICY